MQQLQMRLPEVFRDDVQKFQAEIDRLHRGEITRAQFRSFRVPMGVYEQRESDTYMLRVRFPAGGVLPHQMRALAKASRQYGAGVLHVTSRQDIQIHRVLLDDIPKAFAVLAEAGLSTRGGGGNTVRNITGCVHAGVCPEEEFDITPYAIALTEFLIGDPLSYQLPRKYKIAFSGCAQDCAGVAVNDVGFVARRRNGQIGFAVYVGGGMGAHSRVGELLEEFVPADQIHLIAEAVKRVFDQHGNRRNRAKARLRFLIEKIGLEGFRKLYEAELQRLREQNVAPLETRPVAEPDRRPAPPATSPAPEFDAWRRVNTTAQKQPGFWIVHIPLRLGDITADTMEQLADVVERFGEGAARTTQDQNLVLRWVTEEELPALHAELSRLGLARTDAPVLRNMIACAGAATCRLGICLSRGLADAVCRALERNAIDLEKLGNLRVYISGCPNACGRHPIGDVSLSGAARRVKSRLVPHYVVRLGGRVGEGTTRLADGKMTLPARNVPAFLTDF
ncbi:MAG: nitrite/sulfite reductase, partial [Planctomycetes bacterium]|nr:nitrite/sulfite reductase [Planctomycetota bacterium]